MDLIALMVMCVSRKPQIEWLLGLLMHCDESTGLPCPALPNRVCMPFADCYLPSHETV